MQFFNSRVSLVFNAIERCGLHVHVPNDSKNSIFIPLITDPRSTLSITLKTTTTRPSNKFNGVNYAALNKENGC